MCGTYNGILETSYTVHVIAATKDLNSPCRVGPISLSRVLLARVHVVSIPSHLLHQRSLHIRNRYRNEKLPRIIPRKVKKKTPDFGFVPESDPYIT